MAERGIRSRFATPKLRDWQTSCHRKVSLRIATGNPHPRISGSNIHSQSIIIQFYIFFGSSIRNLARSESFTTLACHLSTERLKIERRASAARRMAEREGFGYVPRPRNFSIGKPVAIGRFPCGLPTWQSSPSNLGFESHYLA